MNFRELASEMDDAVEEAVLDDGVIDGQPVRGRFAAPWLDARIGTLRTALTQPQFTVRDGSVGAAQCGSVIEAGGASYDVVDMEPMGDGWTVFILRPVA